MRRRSQFFGYPFLNQSGVVLSANQLATAGGGEAILTAGGDVIYVFQPDVILTAGSDALLSAGGDNLEIGAAA